MTSQPTPGCVYLLADHLDMLLAAGEDLQKLSFRNLPGEPAEATDNGSLQGFVRQVRALESAAIGRLICARAQADHLESEDDRFALLAKLFRSGTAHITDVLAQFHNPETAAFDYGDDPIGYLRSRGLIAQDSGCLAIVEQLSVGEDFLVGGHIELGSLLDLCAQFLDTLDTHFGLFPEIPPASEIVPKPAVGRSAFF